VALTLIEQQAEAQLEASRRPLTKALTNKKVTHLSIGSDEEEEFPWSEVEDSESEVEIIEKVSDRLDALISATLTSP